MVLEWSSAGLSRVVWAGGNSPSIQQKRLAQARIGQKVYLEPKMATVLIWMLISMPSAKIKSLRPQCQFSVAKSASRGRFDHWTWFIPSRETV